MKEVFVVQKACYQEESQEMELRIAGVLPLEKAGRKLRMIAFFEGKNVSRRFSLDVNSYVAGDAVPFHIRQKISLRDIFYSFQKEQAYNNSFPRKRISFPFLPPALYATPWALYWSTCTRPRKKASSG